MKEQKNLRDLDELRFMLNSALAAKYGQMLNPGETLILEIDRNKEFVKGSIFLSASDDSERFEFEAVRLETDQEELFEGSLDDVLDIIIDYLDCGLEFYFDEERFIHHNDDWRKAEYQGQVLRYRSALRRPALDALADAWLAANGDPDALQEYEDTVAEYPVFHDDESE